MTLWCTVAKLWCHKLCAVFGPPCMFYRACDVLLFCIQSSRLAAILINACARQLKSLLGVILSTFWSRVVLEGKTTRGRPHLCQVRGLCVHCAVTNLFFRFWWLKQLLGSYCNYELPGGLVRRQNW